MNTKLYIIGCLALFLIPIHDASGEGVFDECTDHFLETREIALDQDEQLLGEVNSAAQLDDGSFAVATEDPGVFLFDADGSFIRMLGRAGQGPFEYQGSLVVRATQQKVAVWDKGNRKLMEFAPDGTNLREWTQIGQNVSDFVVWNDTLYAYQSGGANEDYLMMYRHDARDEAIRRFGDAPGEHFALALLDGSDPITYDSARERVLYASPAEPIVHLYDPADDSQNKWRIEDPRFTTDAVRAYASFEDVNANILEASEQAFQSSRFYSLHTAGDNVLSVLQHGELIYERSFAEAVAEGAAMRGGTEGTLDVGNVETQTRVLHVRLHTPRGEVIACESLPLLEIETVNDSPIVGPTPQGFLVLNRRGSDGAAVDYILTEYYLPEGSGIGDE